MNPIIYIDGALADAMGAKHIRDMLDGVAKLMRREIDGLVHGASEYHAEKRFTGKPE